MIFQNGVGATEGTSSRFSQFFKRESPPIQNQSNQQRSDPDTSIHDELLNNLLNDISEPKIQIPSVTESNTYFAPISPAANTHNNVTKHQLQQLQQLQQHQQQQHQQQMHNQQPSGIKLLEMLQRNNKPSAQNGQVDVTNTIMGMMKNLAVKENAMGEFLEFKVLSLRRLATHKE